MTSHVAWKGLLPRSRRAWSRWLSIVYAHCSTGRVRLKSCCEPFGGCPIQVLQPSMISRPRLLPHGCLCATRAPSTSGHRNDLLTGHKRDRRFDESGPTNRELDGWAEPWGSRGYLYDRSRRNTFRCCQTAGRQTAHGVGRGRPPVFGCLPLRTGPGTGWRSLRDR